MKLAQNVDRNLFIPDLVRGTKEENLFESPKLPAKLEIACKYKFVYKNLIFILIFNVYT